MWGITQKPAMASQLSLASTSGHPKCLWGELVASPSLPALITQALSQAGAGSREDIGRNCPGKWPSSVSPILEVGPVCSKSSSTTLNQETTNSCEYSDLCPGPRAFHFRNWGSRGVSVTLTAFPLE